MIDIIINSSLGSLALKDISGRPDGGTLYHNGVIDGAALTHGPFGAFVHNGVRADSVLVRPEPKTLLPEHGLFFEVVLFRRSSGLPPNVIPLTHSRARNYIGAVLAGVARVLARPDGSVVDLLVLLGAIVRPNQVLVVLVNFVTTPDEEIFFISITSAVARLPAMPEKAVIIRYVPSPCRIRIFSNEC